MEMIKTGIWYFCIVCFLFFLGMTLYWGLYFLVGLLTLPLAFVFLALGSFFGRRPNVKMLVIQIVMVSLIGLGIYGARALYIEQVVNPAYDFVYVDNDDWYGRYIKRNSSIDDRKFRTYYNDGNTIKRGELVTASPAQLMRYSVKDDTVSPVTFEQVNEFSFFRTNSGWNESPDHYRVHIENSFSVPVSEGGPKKLKICIKNKEFSIEKCKVTIQATSLGNANFIGWIEK